MTPRQGAPDLIRRHRAVSIARRKDSEKLAGQSAATTPRTVAGMSNRFALAQIMVYETSNVGAITAARDMDPNKLRDYMQKFGVDSNADIARTLAMFGGFTEGLQLFASCLAKNGTSKRNYIGLRGRCFCPGCPKGLRVFARHLGGNSHPQFVTQSLYGLGVLRLQFGEIHCTISFYLVDEIRPGAHPVDKAQGLGLPREKYFAVGHGHGLCPVNATACFNGGQKHVVHVVNVGLYVRAHFVRQRLCLIARRLVAASRQKAHLDASSIKGP